MHHGTDIRQLKEECSTAESFEELADIAVREMEKFDEAEVVCGPVSSGGLGSVEKNLQAFIAVIHMLKKEGRPMFSQEPYEERIAELRRRWFAEDPAREGTYCMPILEVMYDRLYSMGRVRKAWFIPGWESSRGSQWEHAKFKAAGVEIEYLTPERIQSIL